MHALRERDLQGVRMHQRIPLAMLVSLLFALGSARVEAASSLVPVCEFKNVRWEHSAKLAFPGTRVVYGDAWGNTGSRVRLEGTLGLDGLGAWRFHAALSGRGIEAEGEIDPNEEHLLALLEPRSLGELGVIVKGGVVRLQGRAGGEIVVTAPTWATDLVRPRGPWPTMRVTCPDLSVHVQGLRELNERALLERAGLDLPGAWELTLREGRIPLRESPGGRVVGHLLGRHVRGAWGLERQEAWVHVARPHWQGTVWHGWVREKDLAAETQVGGLGVSGMLGLRPERECRICEAPLPLRARVGDEEREVGRVLPGTPVVILALDGASARVMFPHGWLRAVEGAELRVPAEVAACPLQPKPPAPAP
jgi:hypothetical protein